jgi:hypothetical protein
LNKRYRAVGYFTTVVNAWLPCGMITNAVGSCAEG